mmetsp:Transcript_78391/g.226677  ORF Transcript_78391/g.226677 Transcript_78391/m.226677 type:complete len:218 (+) Transcript_78391:657-1310(+)
MRRRRDYAVQRRRPVEHESVHGALEGGHDDAEEERAAVSHQEAHGLRDVVHERRGLASGVSVALLAIVLLEEAGDEPHRHEQASDGQVERTALPPHVEEAALGDGAELGRVRHGLPREPRGDGDQVHRGEHQAEHVTQEAAGEGVPLRVLRDHPTFEAGEEHRGGNAARDATDHQDRVILEVFRRARDDVQDAIQDAGQLPAELVRERPHEATEDQR